MVSDSMLISTGGAAKSKPTGQIAKQTTLFGLPPVAPPLKKGKSSKQASSGNSQSESNATTPIPEEVADATMVDAETQETVLESQEEPTRVETLAGTQIETQKTDSAMVSIHIHINCIRLTTSDSPMMTTSPLNGQILLLLKR